MAYANTQAHLDAALDRIDAILDAYERRDDPGADSPDTESRPPMATTSFGSDPDRIPLALPEDDCERIRTMAADISEQCRDTDDATLRLERLTEGFDLSRRQLDAFLLALAPQLDVDTGYRYERLDGATATRRLTVNHIRALFGITSEETTAAATLVGDHSPLHQHGLLTIEPGPEHHPDDRTARIGVEKRIISYLEGDTGLDPALDGTATLETTATSLDDLHIAEDLHQRLDTIAARDTPTIHYFYGPEGSQRESAARALADERLLQADLGAILELDVLDRLYREAVLQDCPLLLTNADAALETDAPSLGSTVASLADLEHDLYLLGNTEWTPTTDVQNCAYELVEFPKPDFDLRRELWAKHADEFAEDVDIDVLASTFELTQGGVEEAIQTARAISDGEPLDREALVTGCKAQSAQGLEDLAERIEPSASWEEIVLPEKTERQLREVAAHVKHRGTVYESWGFEERFSRGTGVISMFAGPSGTGKTMAAEIIAADAGMDLYRIDLSSVVSKYIGETEEKLEEIFAAARDSNAILLFDEADAVFGERAEVSDATDRYANAEVNYLLQRLESYDGVVLMTTNYESNIDTAFKRRIHQTVSFKRPDTEAREVIWQVTFPEDTPTGDLDYEFLADLDLTGGNIRNAAQTAAVLAADDDGVVQMKHVVSAVKREYDKLGKLLDPTDFEEYRALLNGEEPQSSSANQQAKRERSGRKNETSNEARTASSDTNDTEPQPGEGPETPEAVVRAFVSLLSAGQGEAAHNLYHSRALADEISVKKQQIREHKQYEITSDIEQVRKLNGRRIVQFDRVCWDDHDTVVYELREDDGQWRIFDFGLKRERNLHIG
jgi:ATP-dependent 26S proteasome regulatory subunit